jgi:hypothetical protein
LCPSQVPLPLWASPSPLSSPISSARNRCAFWWLDWMLLYKLKIREIVTTIPTSGVNVETVESRNICFTV